MATSLSTTKQVWQQNGITLTNDKGSSTNNVGDYANPARFYKSSKITVEAPGNITAIKFVCNSAEYATAAKKCSEDFRACGGVSAAADFIENAPHTSNGEDVVAKLNQANGKFQFFYWMLVIAVITLISIFLKWKFVWVIGVAAGIFSTPVMNFVQKKNYETIVSKKKSKE